MTDKPKSRVQPPFAHSEKPREPVAAEEPKAEGWAKHLLGAFDWRSAASLRAPENPGLKADRAWDSTVDGKAPTLETAMAAALEALIRSR